MKKYGYFLLVSFLFILTSCANYVVNDSLKQKIYNKKPTATLIKPDTHIIIIDGNNTKEIASKSKEASVLFKNAIKQEFSDIVYINE